MRTTVYDIARAAGVSRGTVQRALWDRDRIDPATKERIKKIAEELHYRPNHMARRLTLGKSNLIGVVHFPTAFSVAHSTLESIASTLHAGGYNMLFISGTGQDEAERYCLDQLFYNHVAGAILVLGPSAASLPVCQELIDSGVKIVLLEAVLDGLPVPQLVPDHYRTTELLTQHLLSLGHSNIAYLAIPQTSFAGRERAQGFLDTMRKAGVSVPPSSVIETDFSDVAGAQAMTELLKRPDPPTAVIARHDVVAVGAMQAITSAGLSIPEDISLVGTADMWFTYMLKTPLTTVSHRTDQLAALAVRRLAEMLDGREETGGIEKLGVELVVRSSTGPPRMGRPG